LLTDLFSQFITHIYSLCSITNDLYYKYYTVGCDANEAKHQIGEIHAEGIYWKYASA